MTYHAIERDGFFFVVDEELGEELVTVFDYEVTAREIAAKVNLKYPFFASIPTRTIGSAYPRRDTIVPRPYPRKVTL